ncbi:hypothetical protein THASP1DRAFT_27958 [Thamnocephalis sphaerospora]|uniref:Uncharacterized protein n=1 Tax=Thamnocephalis sphaerospora TaxID=78915 RepID=A0A4P9XVG1_9FUNG|nr:hypothetical protein THASP1DRAFT_27958 [Thamnocephalis sphaerospora]|eukprot:RKP10274.1 hypothetical protein THASP1DRAFT_27958 [Thamnocephalis sphaerospora]
MSLWNDIKCIDLLGNNWEKNATYLWGIPLHPLGELNTLDFITMAHRSMEQMRVRNRSLSMQSAINVVFIFIFARSLSISVPIVYQNRRTLAGWCCVIQATAGVVYCVSCLMVFLPNGPPCRVALWITGTGTTISTLCVGTTLLQKAYLAHQRNKWLLCIGIVLLLPQPAIAYIVWTSPGIMTPVGGCLSCYPSYLPWIKLAMDLPINLVFSTAFLTVVYRQYRIYGSKAWVRLIRNGIQTMCLVVLSNLICMFGVAFEFAGLFSQFFFILDWVVTSVLLVHHCVNMRMVTEQSSRANPRQFLREPALAGSTYAEIHLTQHERRGRRVVFRR